MRTCHASASASAALTSEGKGRSKERRCLGVCRAFHQKRQHDLQGARAPARAPRGEGGGAVGVRSAEAAPATVPRGADCFASDMPLFTHDAGCLHPPAHPPTSLTGSAKAATNCGGMRDGLACKTYWKRPYTPMEYIFW